MSVPILLVVGEAGSGKDTVARIIAEQLNGVTIALADPMKRFVHKTFGFSTQQLWGPSETRNAPDTSFTDGERRAQVLKAVDKESDDFVREMLPRIGHSGFSMASLRLCEWAEDLMAEAYALKSLTPRKVLQTLGTEWGRSFDEDMWINYALERAFGLLRGRHGYDPTLGEFLDLGNSGYGAVVISDGRFRNELLGVKKVGGLALKVVDPDAIAGAANAAEKAGVAKHRSETEQRRIPDHFFDTIFGNDHLRGLTDCEWAVKNVVTPSLFHVLTLGRQP